MKSKEDKKYYPVECSGYWFIQSGPNYEDSDILDAEKVGEERAEKNARLIADLLNAHYAQQSQPSGMRWVRASERTSAPDVFVLIRFNGEYYKAKYVKGLDCYWGDSIPDEYCEKTIVEWLDESSPAGAAEGASEVTSDILKGLGFNAAMKQHETWWLGPIIVHFDSKWWWQIDGDFEDDNRGSDIRELKSVLQLHQIIELFT